MFKRFCSLLLCMTFMFGSVVSAFSATTYTQAQSRQEKIQETVNSAIALMKIQFDSQYEQIGDRVKEYILDNGLDYSLTYDSYTDQPNPLRGAEFIEYLSTYLAARAYASENALYLPFLNEIQFIDYDIEIKSGTDYIPLEIDNYVQDADKEGEYWKQGTRFITAPEEIPLYIKQDNGRYKRSGETILLTPKEKPIKYGIVTLSHISTEDFCDILGIDRDLISDDIEARKNVLTGVTSDEAITQELFLSLPSLGNITNKYDLSFLNNISIENNRSIVLRTALSLLGKVPYEWGGKASSPGYDTKWWSYNSANGLQHGLDCSGFVQWTFMTSGFPKDITGQLISTKTILNSSIKSVSSSDLKPGDIGVTNRANGSVNHTGIYIGNNLWAHCSSSAKTVIISEFNFSKFFDPYDGGVSLDQSIVQRYLASRQMTGLLKARDGLSDFEPADVSSTDIFSDDISNYIDNNNTIYYIDKYSEEETELLAKLMYNEAGSEGINGWIAVAEVVMNRLSSDIFPNSIEEIIYQAGQFSHTERLENITPTNDLIQVAQMVMSGNLKVLNNPDVLYFRNPQITSNISPEENVPWGEHKWVCCINKHAFYTQ